MWEFNINVHSFQQVQDFVALAAAQKFDVTVGNDHQRINGKDLMGMFSLDFNRSLYVAMHCSEEEFDQFRQKVEAILA